MRAAAGTRDHVAVVWDEQVRTGLEVALNEAEVVGLRIASSDSACELLVHVGAQPEPGAKDADPRRVLRLLGATRIRVLLREDRQDGYGPRALRITGRLADGLGTVASRRSILRSVTGSTPSCSGRSSPSAGPVRRGGRPGGAGTGRRRARRARLTPVRRDRAQRRSPRSRPPTRSAADSPKLQRTLVPPRRAVSVIGTAAKPFRPARPVEDCPPARLELSCIRP